MIRIGDVVSIKDSIEEGTLVRYTSDEFVEYIEKLMPKGVFYVVTGIDTDGCVSVKREGYGMELWVAEEWLDNGENDMVNSPPHYTTGTIEVIDYIEDKELGYHLGNAVKYISRAGKKGCAKTDILKAIWYLERYAEMLDDGDNDCIPERTV